MSEKANFFYEGNVVLKIGGSQEAPPAPTIVITGVQHIIPVNVSVVVNGEPNVVTAYVDYSNMEINLPSSAVKAVINPELFKANLKTFFADRDTRESVEYEAKQMEEVESRRQAARQAAAAVASRSAELRVANDDDEE